MAGDDSKASSPLRVALRLTLDGARPSGTLEWLSAAVPAVAFPLLPNTIAAQVKANIGRLPSALTEAGEIQVLQ